MQGGVGYARQNRALHWPGLVAWAVESLNARRQVRTYFPDPRFWTARVTPWWEGLSQQLFRMRLFSVRKVVFSLPR